MISVLYQANTEFDFDSAIAQSSRIPQIVILLHLTYYPDSKTTSLLSYSPMFHAQQRKNKYQFYSVWFDLTGSTTIKTSMLTLAPLRWVKQFIFVSYKMTLFFSAVMISSDLDSETDLDILLERKQTSQEEDDFYDFYEQIDIKHCYILSVRLT